MDKPNRFRKDTLHTGVIVVEELRKDITKEEINSLWEQMIKPRHDGQDRQSHINRRGDTPDTD